jgi:hypothetical protein
MDVKSAEKRGRGRPKRTTIDGRPFGRPSKYTPELGALICERMASGETLQAICREPGMPDISTIYRWAEAHEDFRASHARARIRQADAFVDGITDICDTEEDPARARVRMDARKWVASKMIPERYGDRTNMQLTGADGGAPKFVVEIVRFSDKPGTDQ